MGEIFKATNSYNYYLTVLHTRNSNSSGSTVDSIHGVSDIQFAHDKLINNRSYISQLKLYVYLSSISTTTYTGFSINNQSFYAEGIIGGFSLSNGWKLVTLTDQSEIGNIIGINEYWRIGYYSFYTGNVETSSLPSGTRILKSDLIIGPKSNNDYCAYAEVTWADEFTKPTAINLTPSSSTVNPTIANNLSWSLNCPDGSTQTGAVVEWKIGENGTVNTVNATTSSTVSIPANSFGSGNTIYWRVKLTASNGNTGAFTDWTAFTTYVCPIITSLEPDSVPQNGNNQIVVTFSGSDIDVYTLLVKQSNSTVLTFTGTTSRQAVIPPNTLSKGNVTLELIATKTGSPVTATSTATFTVYGKPSPPVQDLTALYSSSKPSFTWTSSEQEQYNVIIETIGGVEVVSFTATSSTIKSYTSTVHLSNNTLYVIKVRVRNNYELWSDYSSKTVQISFTPLPTPSINAYTSGYNAIIEMTSPNISAFGYNTVMRSEDGFTWIRIASNLDANDSITDYTLSNGKSYYYKIRAIGQNGQLADSAVITISVVIDNYVITDCTDPSKQLHVNLEPKTNYKRNSNVSYTVYAGCSKPTVEFGTENYLSTPFSFLLEASNYPKYEYMVTNHSVISIRDYMGKSWFGFIIAQDEPYDGLGNYDASMELIEVDFDTEDMLFSNGLVPLKVAFLDGRYKLDGSHLLTGVE